MATIILGKGLPIVRSNAELNHKHNIFDMYKCIHCYNYYLELRKTQKMNLKKLLDEKYKNIPDSELNIKN